MESTTSHATLRFAMTEQNIGTALGYFPGYYSDGREELGDSWYRNGGTYDNPILGSYAYNKGFMHEIGHTLGLRHGHKSTNPFGSLPFDHDSNEFSIMTYRDYIGDDPGLTGSDNEIWGNPQTYMMFDIAALQYLYGADGGNGDDYLNGGAGADNLQGGSGYDWASYSSSMSGVTINLAAGTGTGGEAEGDTLAGIENINGSAFADTIYGGNAYEAFYGNGGSDFLYGLGGNDVLDGGDGDDYLYGGTGADILRGGAGSDWASYSLATGFVSVDLQSATGLAGEALGDILIRIEKLYGSSFGYGLRGDANANVLYGRGGNDTLDGRAGNDYLAGGAGANMMTGGTGNDTFRFDTADFASRVQSTITDFHQTGGSDFDTLLLQGSAGNYSMVNQGGNLLITHTGSGGTILVQNFTVAQMADQVSYF
jgi:serralysin